MALAELEQRGRLRLHVRIDERSASFTALGLAKASRRPVAVLCTSGTAAANFHPAVIEADESGGPAAGAHRRPAARAQGHRRQPGHRPDQAVRQRGALVLRGRACPSSGRGWPPTGARWPARPGRTPPGGAGGLPGPVHLNLAFRDPSPPSSPATPAGPGLARVPGRPPRRAAVDPLRGAGHGARPARAALDRTRRGHLRRRRLRRGGAGPRWPSRRAGRCSPSRRPGPGTDRTRCPPTSTCSPPRNSRPPTGPTCWCRPAARGFPAPSRLCWPACGRPARGHRPGPGTLG